MGKTLLLFAGLVIFGGLEGREKKGPSFSLLARERSGDPLARVCRFKSVGAFFF